MKTGLDISDYVEIVFLTKGQQTCDNYVECHTINRADWRVREGKTYGEKWIGKCDFYLPGSVLKGHINKPWVYDEYGYAKEMVGVIVKEGGADLLAYLKNLDWKEFAKVSLNERHSITPSVIKRAVIAGGFTD